MDGGAAGLKEKVATSVYRLNAGQSAIYLAQSSLELDTEPTTATKPLVAAARLAAGAN